jgi:hypothetical protein
VSHLGTQDNTTEKCIYECSNEMRNRGQGVLAVKDFTRLIPHGHCGFHLTYWNVLLLGVTVLMGKIGTPTASQTRMYPKISGLAAWSENYEWYSSLPLGAVVSLFCESVY